MALLLGVVLVATACNSTKSSSSSSAESTTTTEAQPSTEGFAVGVRTEVFVDNSRPTDANGDFAGAPDRTLSTTIYYPAVGDPDDAAIEGAEPSDAGPFPLVLFSHGVDSHGTAYETLFGQWVDAGYVVVAPDYPLANGDAPGGATIEDLENQPADASFVIDRVLALDDIADLIDPDHIAAAGHSLGAVTTAGLSLGLCCRDDRIDAALLFAAPPFFSGDVSFDVPVLVEQGDADETIPLEVTRAGFEAATPPAFFVTLIGAEHSTPYRGSGGEASDVVEATTLDFLDAYLKGDTDAIDALIRDGDVPGVATIEARV